MKTLVVFYSRTGHTREIGHRIAAALYADIEEIADRANRGGIFGYLRSGRDAWLRRRARLAPLVHDPAAYDLVVVGTPVWNMSLSSPVRTFLQDHKRALHQVAFFCTMNGIGSDRAFAQMEEQGGRRPIATLAVRAHERASPELPGRIRTFVAGVKALRHAA
jgi:menaquinone-dependent protoporphyrinogen IX oxidase